MFIYSINALHSINLRKSSARLNKIKYLSILWWNWLWLICNTRIESNEFLYYFSGNLLVILVVTMSRRLRSITNFFLANLAVADFCVGVFCVIQNLSIYLIDRWVSFNSINLNCTAIIFWVEKSNKYRKLVWGRTNIWYGATCVCCIWFS